MHRALSGEDGMTLIEVLVTLSIVGVLFVTLTQGLLTGVLLSGVQQKHAGAEVLVRSWAEAVKLAAYPSGCQAARACAQGYESTGAKLDRAAVERFEMVVQVECWRPDPGASALGAYGSSCSHDHRLQRVTLTARSREAPGTTGRRVEHTVQIVKRRP